MPDFNDEQKEALKRYAQVYSELGNNVPEKMDELRAKMLALSPTDFEGYRLLGIDLLKWSDDHLGVVREGPLRGESKHWKIMEDAGLSYSMVQDAPEYKKSTENMYDFSETIQSFTEEIRETMLSRLRVHAMEMLKHPENLTPPEMAVTVYWKHGIYVNGTDNPIIEKILSYVEDKQLDKLIGLIGSNSQNPASKEVFERLTGEQLGKTTKVRMQQLKDWAGPEHVKKLEDEYAAKKAEIPLRKLKDSFNKLQSMSIQTYISGTAEVVDGCTYLRRSVESGFDTIFSRKSGAVKEYGLRNSAEQANRTIKDRRVTQFIKDVRDVDEDGRIDRALAKIGIQWAIDRAGQTADTDDRPDPEVEALFGKKRSGLRSTS